MTKRWRDKMPFRAVGEYRRLLNLITSEGRGGEPSPSDISWENLVRVLRLQSMSKKAGYGRAADSYTEKLRMGLQNWVRTNAAGGIISFQYKLSRHKVVNVVGRHPLILHNRFWGDGSKGFVMSLAVLSVDGMKPIRALSLMRFAWNKIIARERFLALPSGKGKVG